MEMRQLTTPDLLPHSIAMLGHSSHQVSLMLAHDNSTRQLKSFIQITKKSDIFWGFLGVISTLNIQKPYFRFGNGWLFDQIRLKYMKTGSEFKPDRLHTLFVQ
jgi:hypothetical protein